MNDLTFYFDPLCPWTWRTSEWIREGQGQQSLDVEWKLFSLSLNNNGPESSLGHLRTRVLARRQGGNQAVNRLYKALGNATHVSGLQPREVNVLETVFPQALTEAGLSPDLYAAAQADPSTMDNVKSEHQEAVDKFKAYGVPWLVPASQDFGFNGPIITDVPQGRKAQELWEHFSYIIAQPYLYEIKRSR